MKVMLLTLLFPITAQAQFLGTNRADIEAALRLYTEKQLADMTRKKREKPAPPPEPKPKEDWDDEVQKLLAEKPVVAPAPPIQPVWPIQPAKAEEPDVDWLQAGFQGFGKQTKEIPESQLISVPAGSYIMGEMLTGVDAPTQTSIPGLIKTRFGFVSPNHGFVDLSGCHTIAKATGDISTERVKLQTLTISCISPERVPFEQKIEAYAAGEDGSFGLPGEMHSRQGRVAMLAFLNGIVEGTTKILSETSSSVVSPMSALGSQGGTSASVEVIRWYLDHAKSILPTVEVRAGAPVRLVLLKSLRVPKSFFKKYSNKENIYETDLVL